MEEKRRGFVATKTKVGNKFTTYGVVICANGKLCDPDYRIPIRMNNLASENEWLETWDNVHKDAAALRWEWRHGRYHFIVALRPEVVTPQMVDTAKRLYQEIRSIHADEIDWADMCLWRHNPTGAPGWNLETKPMLSDEELCAMVEAANKRLENFTEGTPSERPHATLYHLDTGWHICIDSDFGQCNLVPLLNASVSNFLQQERDYICHVMVVRERRHRRKEFASQYEAHRSVIEKYGGQLLDVGTDGFCVIMEGAAEVYGLDYADFQIFTKYCKSL